MQLPLSMTSRASMLAPTHLIFAMLVISVGCHSATAQDDIKPPSLEIAKSGVPQAFPADAAVPSGAAEYKLFRP